MFKYTKSISELSHYIINSYVTNKNIAVDATLGNGHDTDFLREIFRKVYAFDIQEIAVNNYKSKLYENVEAICSSHENFKAYIKEKVDCVIYNLGYLPGANKAITTKVESTLKSLKEALEMLNSEGIIVVVLYPGHLEGMKEATEIKDFVRNLSKKEYGVMIHQIMNRSNTPPELLVIEKK